MHTQGKVTLIGEVGHDETQANAVRLAQLWNLADGLDMADIAAALEALRK